MPASLKKLEETNTNIIITSVVGKKVNLKIGVAVANHPATFYDSKTLIDFKPEGVTVVKKLTLMYSMIL